MKTKIHLNMDSRFEKKYKKLISNTDGFEYSLKPISKERNKKIKFNRIDFLIFGMAAALILSAFMFK
jgi:hypothetical protein